MTWRALLERDVRVPGAVSVHTVRLVGGWRRRASSGSDPGRRRRY